MFKFRITQKIALAFTFIVFIFLLAFAFSFLIINSQYSLQEKLQELSINSDNIFKHIKHTNTNTDYLNRLKIGFLLSKPNLYQYIWFIDESKIAYNIITTEESNIIYSDKIEFLNDIDISKFLIEQKYINYYSLNMIVSIHPTFDIQNNYLGSFITFTSITYIDKITFLIWKRLETSILFSSLLAATFGVIFSFKFSTPLKKIHSKTLQMISGDYSNTLSIYPDDEIGEIQYSLDTLSLTLSQNFHIINGEKDKLNNILKSISDGILAFDTNNNIINYNIPFLNLIEIDPSTNNLKDAIIDKLTTMEIIYICTKVSTTNTKIDLIKKISHNIIKFIISPINHNNTDNSSIGVIIFAIDITKSYKLDELRQEFIANVSHEFRTPLTVIRGYLESIIDEAVDSQEEAKKYLNNSLDEVHCLEVLLTDLLALSTLESDKIYLNNQHLDLIEILDDLILKLSHLSSKKNIAIILDYDLSEHYTVYADYQKIRQVFIILIDNAIKYSKTDSKIIINLSNSFNTITFSISDTGIGISSKDLPYIWDRFYKVDKSGSKLSGTGIGLSIAKKILDIYSFDISVTSQLDKGSSFKINFKKS